VPLSRAPRTAHARLAPQDRRGGSNYVPQREIYRYEVRSVGRFAKGRVYAVLVNQQGTVLPLDYPLDRLTQVLNPCQFFRVSWQYLVSLAAIHTVPTSSASHCKLELLPAPRHEVEGAATG
jgi:DNA-binding LytR/AlgR family response regulator